MKKPPPKKPSRHGTRRNRRRPNRIAIPSPPAPVPPEPIEGLLLDFARRLMDAFLPQPPGSALRPDQVIPREPATELKKNPDGSYG